MAAAAFTATLLFRGGNGAMLSRYATVSDVNAAYYVFSDGNAFLTLPAGDWFFQDLILSAAGTDTKSAAVYLNGAPTSLVVVNAANVYNVLQRQIASTAPRLQGGSTLKFVQAT